jgi:prepilin signal peptidase PulO-like enzyme (type II secretory pathway)
MGAFAMPVHSTLDWVALGLVIFGTIAVITVFLIIHEIPYKVAKKNQHPHVDAIHAACWISVFSGGLIWPLTLIWSYMGKTPIVAQVSETTGKEEE